MWRSLVSRERFTCTQDKFYYGVAVYAYVLRKIMIHVRYKLLVMFTLPVTLWYQERCRYLRLLRIRQCLQAGLRDYIVCTKLVNICTTTSIPARMCKRRCYNVKFLCRYVYALLSFIVTCVVCVIIMYTLNTHDLMHSNSYGVVSFQERLSVSTTGYVQCKTHFTYTTGFNVPDIQSAYAYSM
jgi:hypothetical protein